MTKPTSLPCDTAIAALAASVQRGRQGIAAAGRASGLSEARAPWLLSGFMSWTKWRLAPALVVACTCLALPLANA